MRSIKLCIALGLLAAVVWPASATDIQYNAAGAGYNGPVKWKITNWDMGAIYAGDPSNTAGGGALKTDSLYDGVAALDALTQTNAPGRIGNEDSWGIFKVTEIQKDDGSSTKIWTDKDQNLELVGIFFGGIDNAFVDSTIVGAQVIQSSGLKFMVWEQAAGTLTASLEALGSKGRDGVNMDQYAGVGYNWTDTNLNGVVNPGELSLSAPANLVISGTTTPGVAQIGGSTGPGNERAQFAPSSPTTGDGSKSFYVDVTGGTWQFGPPYSYEAPPSFFAPSVNGDMYVVSSAAANPPSGGGAAFGDWTLLSEDPVRANAKLVPEPLTCFAMVTGFIGLGGYFRRRRSEA